MKNEVQMYLSKESEFLLKLKLKKIMIWILGFFYSGHSKGLPQFLVINWVAITETENLARPN